MPVPLGLWQDASRVTRMAPLQKGFFPGSWYKDPDTGGCWEPPSNDVSRPLAGPVRGRETSLEGPGQIEAVCGLQREMTSVTRRHSTQKTPGGC